METECSTRGLWGGVHNGIWTKAKNLLIKIWLCACMILVCSVSRSFISDIEQVFRQWGLARMDEHGWHSIPPQKQHRKVERIEYAGRRLVISLEVSGNRHSSSPDSEHEWAPAMWEMMDVSLDFPSVAHHISRWYGTQEFVLVMLDEGAEGLRSQAQANLLLSSVAIAVTNTGW